VAERVRIASGELAAEILPCGAELQSLRDAQGREYMSSGDPAFWSGHAPLLFPIVGRLNGDEYRLDGSAYPLPQHGFARKSDFSIIAHDPDNATFRLTDSAETRAVYPFAFELEAHYALTGQTLATTITIRNPGDAALPASFGFHPAFAWPLPGNSHRGAHDIDFECDEPATLCRITPDGLIGPEDRSTPVIGRSLRLRDALFTENALVWKRLESRRLRYGVAGGTSLDIAFPDTDWLGIWTKPGAAFVCVEPWSGMADPDGFVGQFRDKPGVFEIAPGGERRFGMSVTVNA
jgi:galactose mutarotase-like enzyme